ncbi:hypothetical protein [Azotobacter chroococcum]|uniref:hypothetical protein n=1 Tax=Azotobacter chroococcum TaxID=353 RepID=UPI001185F9DE|nr:hypothetical protein [Azotobacter chroococcum]
MKKHQIWRVGEVGTEFFNGLLSSHPNHNTDHSHCNHDFGHCPGGNRGDGNSGCHSSSNSGASSSDSLSQQPLPMSSTNKSGIKQKFKKIFS